MFQFFIEGKTLREYFLDPILDKARRFFFSWLQISLFFIVLYSFSFIVYYLIYIRLLPTPRIQQTVYFDYSLEQPKAIISLSAVHKQWVDFKGKSLIGGSGPRPLKSGELYDIEALIAVSKSPRNLDLGKVALTTTIFDTAAEAIAKSSRPIIIPYYTDTYLLLESIITFPMRFNGYPDSSHIFIPIMKDFQEPYLTFPASELVEMVLNDDAMDLINLELIIVPRLNWLTWWLFHFPKMSFMIGIGLITIGELIAYGFLCVVALLFTLSTSESTEREIKHVAEVFTGFEGLMDEMAVTHMQMEIEQEQELARQRQESQAADRLASGDTGLMGNDTSPTNLSFFFRHSTSTEMDDHNEGKED